MSNHIRWCVKIDNKVDNNYVIVCRRRRRENFGTVPPKHGFPMQKQCFGSVSEAFSTAKPLKNSQKNSASGRITKKPPLLKRSSKRRGGLFCKGGGIFFQGTDEKKIISPIFTNILHKSKLLENDFGTIFPPVLVKKKLWNPGCAETR